jgi:CBS domain containing-hemolysin-like protein
MDALTAAVACMGLLAGNAFCVGAEFALVSARRHRLELAAASGSRAAGSAVAGIQELSLMLAGAQLGITMCSLGLGAVVGAAVLPALGPAVGVPLAVGHAAAFGVALSVVVFLHILVGEMLPRSWAVGAPERSALLLALPFRAYTWLVRPALRGLDAAGDAALRLVGVGRQESLGAHHDPERLRELLGESQRLGLINRYDHDLLTRALQLQETTIGPHLVPIQQVTQVPADATHSEVVERAAASGHTRLVVHGPAGRIVGVLHVRDALVAASTAADAAGSAAGPSAGELARPVPHLAATTPVHEAVAALQHARAQLAVVRDPSGFPAGIVSLDDLLGQLLGSGQPRPRRSVS